MSEVLDDLVRSAKEAQSALNQFQPTPATSQYNVVKSAFTQLIQRIISIGLTVDARKEELKATTDPDIRNEIQMDLAWFEQSIDSLFENEISLYDRLEIDLQTEEYRFQRYGKRKTSWANAGNDTFPEVIPLGERELGNLSAIIAKFSEAAGLHLTASRIHFEPDPGSFRHALPDLIALEQQLRGQECMTEKTAYHGENLDYSAFICLTGNSVQTVLRSKDHLIIFERDYEQVTLISQRPDTAFQTGTFRVEGEGVIYEPATESGLVERNKILQTLHDVFLCLEEDINLKSPHQTISVHEDEPAF